MRLIDADEALKIAERYGTTSGTSLGRHSGIADIIYYQIEKLPTIESEPVRYGRWIGADSVSLYCSECGKSSDYKVDGSCKASLFCPNCGAKMDGGDEDEIN